MADIPWSHHARCLALAAFALSASAVLGQSSETTPPTNQPAFRLKGFHETLAPKWQVQHQLLVYSNTQITFTVPEEYRVAADPISKTVTFYFQGNQIRYGSCQITLRLLPLPQTTNTVDSAWLEQKIIADHPDAKFFEDFPASLGGHAGAGVELRSSRNAVTTASRYVLVPLPETLVEITQSAGADFIANHRQALHQLLLSTRFSPLGSKVEYQMIKLE